MLIDAQTGQAHNIDNVDISQFNEVYLVNPSVDNPLQEFQTVKIQLIEETVIIKEEQEKIDQKVVEQIEVNVNTQVGDVQMKDQDGKVNEDSTEQNKTKEIGENSVRKDDNMNPDDSSHDVTGENEDSTNPDDASPDKKRDVTVTEEKDDTTNPGDARTDTKCDNDNDTKETGETSDVTNEKEGENDKESDVKEDTMCDTKRDVTESDDPKKNRDVTEDNQVKEKVNGGTEEQKDKENAKEENDTSESDIVVLAQYKEKKKNIEVIDLMTSSSDENKCYVTDEDAKEEQKHDVIDEDAKEEQKHDIIDEGVKHALKWQKVPRKIAVKCFYKGDKAYSSKGDVCEKEIEKKNGSLSDGDRHKTDVSPDKCVVTFLKNAVKIKDTVTPRQSEIRSQYRCDLGQKFIKTEYRHKNINIGPEFDFFEDESDLSLSDTSSKDTTDETSATSDKQVVDGEVAGEEEDSILYVTFFYCFHNNINIIDF